MRIEERKSGAVIVLDIQGQMTIEVLRGTVLANRVRQLLQEGHKQILVNIAGVPYVDTSGLCDLVEAYLAATRRDGSLKLVCLTPHVRKMLSITRLLTVLQAYDSEQEAVASFGSSATV